MGGGWLVTILNLLNMGGGGGVAPEPEPGRVICLDGSDRSVTSLTGSDRSVTTWVSDLDC